jgi:hypothetical protein
MKIKTQFLFISLFVLFLTTACNSPTSGKPQGEAVSALTQDEATAIVNNAMEGYIEGDYTAWSRDWSTAMKSAIPEANFLAFREQLTGQVGRLVSIGPVEISSGVNEGFVRWSTLCNFEKGQVRFSFGFANDGKMIEGVFQEVVQ